MDLMRFQLIRLPSYKPICAYIRVPVVTIGVNVALFFPLTFVRPFGLTLYPRIRLFTNQFRPFFPYCCFSSFSSGIFTFRSIIKGRHTPLIHIRLFVCRFSAYTTITDNVCFVFGSFDRIRTLLLQPYNHHVNTIDCRGKLTLQSLYNTSTHSFPFQILINSSFAYDVFIGGVRYLYDFDTISNHKIKVRFYVLLLLFLYQQNLV